MAILRRVRVCTTYLFGLRQWVGQSGATYEFWVRLVSPLAPLYNLASLWRERLFFPGVRHEGQQPVLRQLRRGHVRQRAEQFLRVHNITRRHLRNEEIFSIWPFGKLPFESQKIAKNLTFFQKTCQKLSFFSKIAIANIWKKLQFFAIFFKWHVFDNFMTFKWQFSEGSD